MRKKKTDGPIVRKETTRFGRPKAPAARWVSLMVFLAIGMVGPSESLNATPTQGLVGHWAFDDPDEIENQGIVSDLSGNGNTGTVHGATVAAGNGGPQDGALSFDGVDDYVDVGNDTTLQSSVLTYAAWIYPTGSGNRTIIGGSGGIGPPHFRLTNANKVQFKKQNGTWIGLSASTIANGAWTHVAVSYDVAGNWVIYVDGQPNANGTNLATFTHTDKHIGARNTSLELFSGSIDDVVLYDRVLSAAEIFNLYNDVSDTTPPVRSNGAPSGTLPSGTTQATLSLDTDEPATCKYDTCPGVDFDAMANTFSTTGNLTHSDTVTGLTDGSSYTYYVRCEDQASNQNTTDYEISFSVASGALTLQYRGVFAPPFLPGKTGFAYGLKAMGYDPDCAGQADPSPADGYPGCLIATGHPTADPDKVGMFDIQPPQTVAVNDRTDATWNNVLAHGQFVVEMLDPSLRADGMSIKDDILNPQPNWVAREFGGIAMLPGGNGITSCGHDWYNVSNTDHDWLCWFDGTLPAAPTAQDIDAVGAYTFGPANDPDHIFHAKRMAGYVGPMGQTFADTWLGAGGKQWCFAATQRGGGGGAYGSSGPPLQIFECDGRPAAPAPGPLASMPLIQYDSIYPLTVYGTAFPDWTPSDRCSDATWIDHGGAKGILFGCQKGGPVWWYGKPDPWDNTGLIHRNQCDFNAGNPIWNSGQNQGQSCLAEFNSWGEWPPQGLIDSGSTGKGHHSVFATGPQYRAQAYFFPESELVKSLADPSQQSLLAFETVLDHPAELWPVPGMVGVEPPNHGYYGGIAVDNTNGLLYIAQRDLKARPVIHVYEIEGN